MRIQEIDLEGLEPFVKQRVTFEGTPDDDGLGEVHLFTGPNGTGKSRLLTVLAASVAGGNSASERFGGKLNVHVAGQGPRTVRNESNLPLAKIQGLPRDVSQRPAFAFSGAAVLRDTPVEVMKGLNVPSAADRLSFRPLQPKDANQWIANLKVQAAMEVMNDPGNGRWLSVVQRIEGAIRDITGRRFAVIATAHPKPKLEIAWGDERLPLNGIPDGLNAILSWMLSAACLMDLMCPKSKDPLAEPAIMFLDEPETHLHPAWQRKVLPLAQRLFPRTQFFVATHSPFVVSSVNVGWIHKLRLTADGTVEIAKAIPAPKGDSYLSALSEILEVAEWFDPESEALLERFRAKRDEAMSGDADAVTEAERLAGELRSRGPELANVIGAEMRQLERVLAKSE